MRRNIEITATPVLALAKREPIGLPSCLPGRTWSAISSASAAGFNDECGGARRQYGEQSTLRFQGIQEENVSVGTYDSLQTGLFFSLVCKPTLDLRL